MIRRHAAVHVLTFAMLVVTLVALPSSSSDAATPRAGQQLLPGRTPVVVATGLPASVNAVPVHVDGAANEIDAIPIAKGAITVTGKVVYNDLRDEGHFDWRRDLTGNQGAKPTGSVNYLGAWMVVADFYELDSVAWSPWHSNCHSETYLGSDTLDSYGAYSFSFSATDDCGADNDTVPDIGVRFRLRFCNDDLACFSIEDDGNDIYQLWHPDAYQDDMLYGTSGTHELSTMVYQTTAGDDYAKAACNYAYLVDAMEVWHIMNPVPFDPRGDGEVSVQFPSSEADSHGSAYTANDHQIYLKPGWSYQSTVWHEYGHILHRRAWNGDTGSCGDCPGDDYSRNGDPSWGATELEYPHMAFKEGWAEFAKIVVKYGPDATCGSFDDNESTDTGNWLASADADEYPNALHYVTYPNDGKSFVRNVKKLLCDWYDDRSHDDDDTHMAGTGDAFEASLYSVWYNLDRMWDWVSSTSGLTICDYTDYYLEGRKSSANVGASAHADYVTWISNLAFNNGIECDLTPSSASGASDDDEAHDAEDTIQDKLNKLKEHYDEYGPR